jgi:CRP/FNR family transcriptional regulator, cyclic AMP receptor protein
MASEISKFEMTGVGSNVVERKKIVSLLEATDLFGDFKWQEVQLLASYVQTYKAEAGKSIFRQGDAGGFLCIICEGRVEIMKTDKKSKEKKIATLGRGKIFGEMSIIDEEPRSASCVTAIASTLIILSRENFLRILSEEPKLATKILLKLSRLLSQRLRQSSGMLAEFLPE